MALKLTSKNKTTISSIHIPAGTTIRMNHDACPAGTDTRRRLYVTNDPKGTLCYCHNCAQGCAITSGVRVRVPAAPLAAPAPLILPVASPMSQLGELWIKAWGLTPADEYWYEDSGEKGLVFPFANGHQIRWLHKDQTLKWQTFGKPEFNVYGENKLICEDAISARKWLDADPNHGVSCLFGTNESKALIDSTSALNLVWLDNDNAGVVKIAQTIATHVGTLGGSDKCVLVNGGTDPKRYTKKELNDVRDEARKLCGSAPTTGQPYHVLEVPQPDQRVRAGLGLKQPVA